MTQEIHYRDQEFLNITRAYEDLTLEQLEELLNPIIGLLRRFDQFEAVTAKNISERIGSYQDSPEWLMFNINVQDFAPRLRKLAFPIVAEICIKKHITPNEFYDQNHGESIFQGFDTQTMNFWLSKNDNS